MRNPKVKAEDLPDFPRCEIHNLSSLDGGFFPVALFKEASGKPGIRVLGGQIETFAAAEIEARKQGLDPQW